MKIRVVGWSKFGWFFIKVFVWTGILYMVSLAYLILLREYAGCGSPDSAEMWIIEDVTCKNYCSDQKVR